LSVLRNGRTDNLQFVAHSRNRPVADNDRLKFVDIPMQKLAHQMHFLDEFTLDLTRGCLLRGTQEIKLPPKPFEALKYLVENPGRLISKAELIQTIWPDTAVTDDSLVQCLR